nr:hypothetical protein [Burkholderiales bacterium]
HDEVETAKKGLLEARQVARTQDASVAGRLASYLSLGRTYRWDAELDAKFARLTPDEVRDALRRHVDPSRISVVKAGDFTRLAAKPAGAKAN